MPTSLSFYEISAQVLPLLLITALVQYRLAGLRWHQSGQKRNSATVAIVLTVILTGMIVGEVAAFVALSNGRGSEALHGLVTRGLLMAGFMVLMFPVVELIGAMRDGGWSNGSAFAVIVTAAVFAAALALLPVLVS